MESPPVVRYPYTPPAGTTYGAGAAGAAGPEAAGPGTAGAGAIGPGEDCDDDDDDGAPVPKVAAEEAEVAPGTVFTGDGTVDGDEYVIVEGWAAITVRGEPVAALGPGQLIGRAHLLELGRPDAIVIAKTDMRVLVVQGSDVEAGR